jgi:uncharacterized membrane protein
MKLPHFLKSFFHHGLMGWCMEILFTAADSLRRRDYTLKGCTSLWMFPIYGSVTFLTPLFRCLTQKALWVRGCIYTILIFTAEFASGTFLRQKGLCPWNYKRSKWNIGQVIRLDYAPFWFLAGLLFEHTATQPDKK